MKSQWIAWLTLSLFAFRDQPQQQPSSSVESPRDLYKAFLTAWAAGTKSELDRFVFPEALHVVLPKEEAIALDQERWSPRLKSAHISFYDDIYDVHGKIAVARVARALVPVDAERNDRPDLDAVVVVFRRDEMKRWRIAKQVPIPLALDARQGLDPFQEMDSGYVYLMDGISFPELLKSNYQAILAAGLYSHQPMLLDAVHPSSPYVVNQDFSALLINDEENRGGFMHILEFDYLGSDGEWAFVLSKSWRASTAEGIVREFGGPMRFWQESLLLFRRQGSVEWKLFMDCMLEGWGVV